MLSTFKLSKLDNFTSSSSSSKTPLFLYSSSFQTYTPHAISSLKLFITPCTMAMIIKYQHVFSFILWLSLLLILFFGLFSFSSNNMNSINTDHSNFFSVSPNRKILASRFDFTPFLHRHRLHHHRSNTPAHRKPAESEIDPRYGADKRLVPTGPNPLHH